MDGQRRALEIGPDLLAEIGGAPGDGAGRPGTLVGVIDKRSAGILLFRVAPGGQPEVLLGHMGGPFWARRDAGAWGVIKGEYGADEAPATLPFPGPADREIRRPAMGD